MENELSSRSLSVTVLEAGFMIVLNIVSLLGNTLVCISVYRNTSLRTTTNVYIVALAISDLLSAIFVMPLATGVLISGRWPFGEALCQMHAFFSMFVVYISPITMGFTAANRYVRMCKSEQQYKRFFSKWKSHITLASAWMFVTGYIWVMHLAGLQDYYFDSEYAACLLKHLNSSARIIHYFVVIGLFFVFPLAITMFSYKKVLKKIQEHNAVSVRALQRQNGNTTVSRHEIRLSRSLFAVVFAFMLCWIPSWIITILTRFSVIEIMPRNVQLLCAFLVNLSNTTNPFIYAGMNPLFRREFRRIISLKPGKKIEDTQQPSTADTTQRSHALSPRSEIVITNQQAVESGDFLIVVDWTMTKTDKKLNKCLKLNRQECGCWRSNSIRRGSFRLCSLLVLACEQWCPLRYKVLLHSDNGYFKHPSSICCPRISLRTLALFPNSDVSAWKTEKCVHIS